ncbi:hypothetical protein BKA82DRAFT_4329808 [Pisolithus tinctorius]|nr:hypothetical protein BKA82DRAFT_4329808 [Pisolithus tinctorius]
MKYVGVFWFLMRKYYIPLIPINLLLQILMKASAVYEEPCKGSRAIMPSFNCYTLSVTMTDPDDGAPGDEFIMKSARESCASTSKAPASATTHYESASSCLSGPLAPISSIVWNVGDAFVGTVATQIPPKPMDANDDHTLLFNSFLAAPLLECDGLYVKRKFCGHLGFAIDAYIHHALLDSGKTVLISDLQDASITLFDPQAHT